jgi:DNA polymerase III subunit delta
VAELKPAYLVWGDDDARLDAWRARLRARVAEEAPDATLEVFSGDRLTAEAVAEALGALTFTTGRRYVLADGIEGWREKDLEPVEKALGALPPDTVAVLIASSKVPGRLVEAVERCGGEEHACPSKRMSAGWVSESARDLGFAIEREAAERLIELVPEPSKSSRTPALERWSRRRRLLRELEKLGIHTGPGETVDVETVDALVASSVEKRVFELADALIEDDLRQALVVAEDLRDQGEDLIGVLYGVHGRLRDGHRASVALAAGVSAKEVQGSLRMPEWLARRMVSRLRTVEPERLERALVLLADLDYAIRGAGTRDAETALTLTLAGAAAA